MTTPPVAPDIAAAPLPTPPTPAERTLKGRINEFVGIAFYGQLLKAMRDSPLKGEIGHGGRGEEVFAGQLHMELAQRAGKASSSPLTEAIYRQLMPRGRPTAETTSTT